MPDSISWSDSCEEITNQDGGSQRRNVLLALDENGNVLGKIYQGNMIDRTTQEPVSVLALYNELGTEIGRLLVSTSVDAKKVFYRQLDILFSDAGKCMRNIFYSDDTHIPAYSLKLSE